MNYLYDDKKELAIMMIRVTGNANHSKQAATILSGCTQSSSMRFCGLRRLTSSVLNLSVDSCRLAIVLSLNLALVVISISPSLLLCARRVFILERAARFELATYCLEGSRSTAELRPHWNVWCHRLESNQRRWALQAHALPTELPWRLLMRG